MALLAACFFTLVFASQSLAKPSLAVVPLPHSIEYGSGNFQLNKDSRIIISPFAPKSWQQQAELLAESLRRLSGTPVTVLPNGNYRPGDVLFQQNKELANGGYLLDIDDTIHLQAASPLGMCNGLATLLQLLGASRDQTIPQMTIRDRPDSVLRIFMVDLGRNPHSLQVLKQTVDMLWLYKVPYLQLHLTDDQRFAFPSTAYPKLNQDSPDFSLDELKALEAYASARGVTIIPELDVPGHSTKLRKHYPEVFGKNATETATLPSSRAAMKTLIDEMLAVFQTTPYFHVGGDEAFGVPVEAQRDLINELNRHVKSHGKTTLVWEGPSLGKGDNKVATDVIHVNWRTINFPADEMIRAGYQVVNAAWDPLYIVDHYPRNNFTMAAPQDIYEQLSLLRFKHFNPDIRTFAKPIFVPAGSPILGFCMPWWEGREENYMRLCRPRLAAMAARAWNSKGEHDYDDYSQRNKNASKALQQISTPVAIHAAPLAIESAGVFHNETEIQLTANIPGEIYYTLDGSVPDQKSTRYTQAIPCTQTSRVRAVLFAEGKQIGHVSERLLTRVIPEQNLALGKPVTSSVASGPFFCVERLTDGGMGNLDFYLGYPGQPEPIVITVDLQQPMDVNQVVVHEYTAGKSFEDYTLFISLNGQDYQQIGQSGPEKKQDGTIVFDFDRTKARYLQIRTKGHRHQVFSSFSRLTEIQAFNR